jgi:hypothetical protein
MTLAARTWTYWLSIPILAAVVLNLIGFTIVYYRKVVVPRRQLEDLRSQALQTAALRTLPVASSTPAAPGVDGAAPPTIEPVPAPVPPVVARKQRARLR